MTLGDTAALMVAVQSVENHRRKVPVPRRLLTFLARATRPAIVATALGHLLRCMYYRDEGCSPIGRCKASWVAKHFEMDLRNIKSARKELQAFGEEGGLLIRHDSPHWTVNRFGPRVEINLNWLPPGFVKRRKSPPRQAAICTESPPPDSNRELSSKEETKNAAPPVRSGFFETKRGRAVDLRNVQGENLCDDRALLTLYEQATSRAILPKSESTRLQFFAAAEHARRCGQSNPPGLFVAVVRRRLWHHITQAEEDAARVRLKRHALSHAPTQVAPMPTNRPVASPLSSDERLRIRMAIRHSLQTAAAA